MNSLVPSRSVLGGVLVALLIVTAWELGERRGERRADARAAALAEEVSRATEAMTDTVPDETLDAEAVAILRGERDMLRETVRSLRDALERADRLAADERAELELYRRVGADESAAGLAIDTLERRGEDPAVLRVTLVQVRGRDRVTGRVEIVPLEADAPALPPASTGEASAAPTATAPGTWSAPFDLRFFETLEIPLDGPFPETVEVRVVPADEPHAPFRARFRREAVRIVD